MRPYYRKVEVYQFAPLCNECGTELLQIKGPEFRCPKCGNPETLEWKDFPQTIFHREGADLDEERTSKFKQ